MYNYTGYFTPITVCIFFSWEDHIISEQKGFYYFFICDLVCDLLQMFLLFLSLLCSWYSYYAYITSFAIILGYSVFCFSVIFLFVFQFWKFLLTYTQAQRFLSSVVCSLLMSPSKALFILYSVFDVFVSFLGFISLFTVHICSCTLSTFQL